MGDDNLAAIDCCMGNRLCLKCSSAAPEIILVLGYIAGALGMCRFVGLALLSLFEPLPPLPGVGLDPLAPIRHPSLSLMYFVLLFVWALHVFFFASVIRVVLFKSAPAATKLAAFTIAASYTIGYLFPHSPMPFGAFHFMMPFALLMGALAFHLGVRKACLEAKANGTHMGLLDEDEEQP